MSTRVINFRVERESAIGTRQLLKLIAPTVSPTANIAPALLYLDPLMESGRRTQRLKLETAARLLGCRDGLNYYWGGMRAAHLEFLIGRLKQAGYAPSYMRSILSAVRRVARCAWHLEQMPLEAYERLRDVELRRLGDGRRRDGRALSFDEVQALFDSCERDERPCALRDACLIALLYAGTMRRFEALSLELSSYNRRAHTFAIRGKGNKSRTVYIASGGARRALHAYLRTRGDWPGPLVCPVDHEGRIVRRRLSATGVHEALRRLCARAGVAHATAHDLRRSLGTHLEDQHIDITRIQRLLGHSDPRVTQVYIRTEERQLRETAMKIKVEFRAGGRGGGRRRGRRRGKSSWRAALRAKL